MQLLDKNMLNNLDWHVDFSDWWWNDYQHHVLLFLDLILRWWYKELPYNKILFRTIKKYGRDNITKKISEFKRKYRGEIQHTWKNLDLYVKWDARCFEDINILHQKKQQLESHIFIQVKWTGKNDRSCTQKYKEIFINFFKNCNFDVDRSAFFIVMNFKINNTLLKILNNRSSWWFQDNYIEFILKIIKESKNKSWWKTVTRWLIKSAKKYINNSIISTYDANILIKWVGSGYEEDINKMIHIIEKTYFIEHLSLSEIENLLKNGYGDNYYRFITLAKDLSTRKSIKDLSESDNSRYLKYNDTYFQELIKHTTETSIEDWGFFDIL